MCSNVRSIGTFSHPCTGAIRGMRRMCKRSTVGSTLGITKRSGRRVTVCQLFTYLG